MSEGCKFCYAERDTKRYGLDVFGPKASRQLRAEAYWKQVPKWNQAAIEAGERRRVFCMSFGDIWEDRPELRDHRARMLGLQVRGLSCEPLVGDLVDIGQWLATGQIHWAIVGGESGARDQARPMQFDWALRIRQACRDYGAAFWWKQWGNHVPDRNGGMVFVAKKVDGDLAGEVARELPKTRLQVLVP